MSAPVPRFFFGAMSPYSWFAAERIERLLPHARWRGVFAGALFKANGRGSWALTERREPGIADCEARAAQHGLGPIRWPEPWPTSDLLIARAMAFVERSANSPAQPPAGRTAGDGDAAAGRALKVFALAAMRLAFLEGADLGEVDAVLEAGRRVGINAEELRAALAEPQVKDALRAVNDEALSLGVFGVPTIVVGERSFWGDDRLAEAASADRAAQQAGAGFYV
jgi:2-hydroxychromene-2-carboxylate isomerase